MPGGYIWEAKRQSIFFTRWMVITRCSALAVAVCLGVLVSHRICIHVWICVWMCVQWYVDNVDDCIFGLQLLIFTSPPSSLSLQLFELLGPEGLEMISTLLQRRVAIVDCLLTIPPDRLGFPPGETTPWQLCHPRGNLNSTCINNLK